MTYSETYPLSIWFMLMLLVLLFTAVEPVYAADRHRENLPAGLFGSVERFSSDAKRFAKWQEMLERFRLHEARLSKWAEAAPVTPDVSAAAPVNPRLAGSVQNRKHRCQRRNRLSCNRRKWQAFLASQQGSKGLELLTAVNTYMNRAPYIIDPVNWNLPDYWATPNEFFLKDGDCEDYAISKYVTLKRLGWPLDSMRIVVLRDENLRVAHAVLSVQWQGESYILDNQVDRVMPHMKILHYRPVYSINETGWWLHQRAKRF